MHTTKLRKIGGSVMIEVPPLLLELLHVGAGSTVSMSIEGGRIGIEPKPRPRYTLARLIAASDYSEPQPAEERGWVDAPAVGRELTGHSG